MLGMRIVGNTRLVHRSSSGLVIRPKVRGVTWVYTFDKLSGATSVVLVLAWPSSS